AVVPRNPRHPRIASVPIDETADCADDADSVCLRQRTNRLRAIRGIRGLGGKLAGHPRFGLARCFGAPPQSRCRSESSFRTEPSHHEPVGLAERSGPSSNHFLPLLEAEDGGERLAAADLLAQPALPLMDLQAAVG